MNLHIITGASRGLGEALAEYFVQQGDRVIDISRSGCKIEGVKSYSFDLAGALSVDSLIDQIFSDFEMNQFAKISLTNNAGMVEPIKPIEKLASSDIFKNLTLNLFGPMVLSSSFLKKTSPFKGVRIITNVSSGVAKNPVASWSVYSAAKAGLESFSSSLALENIKDKNIKIINYGPGIIDTEMQATIRNTSHADFEERERFVSYKDNGNLLPASVVGNALGTLILKNNLAQRTFTTVQDLI